MCADVVHEGTERGERAGRERESQGNGRVHLIRLRIGRPGFAYGRLRAAETKRVDATRSRVNATRWCVRDTRSRVNATRSSVCETRSLVNTTR